MSVEEVTSSEYRFVEAYFDVLEDQIGEWFNAFELSRELEQDISQASISKNLSYLSREYGFLDVSTDERHRKIFKVADENSLKEVKTSLENDSYLRTSQKTIDEKSVARQVKAELEGEYEELDLQVYIVNKLGEQTDLSLAPRLKHSKEVVEELSSLEDIQLNDKTYSIR